MSALRVCLHHGNSWVARAIRWQTRSHWNHASLLYNGELWEAIEGRGVVRGRTLEEARQLGEVAVFDIVGMTPQGVSLALDFMARQLGKPYDYWMVAGFVVRAKEDRKQLGAWFCSEFDFASVRKGGVALLERIEPFAVAPRDLAISPRLVAA